MNFFADDPIPAAEVRAAAQRIAFAPIVFQASRLLRDSGILESVKKSGSTGLTLNEVVSKTAWPRYGVKVLLEAGLGIGLLRLHESRFIITRLGFTMLSDAMTRANMDFMHEICYRGFFDLETALKEGRPAGLKTITGKKTLYEGLATMPPHVRDSWLAFDHYYSDKAFPAALPLVFKDATQRLLDVGGNTGKWALQCAKFDPTVQITIADLPGQLQLARANVNQAGFENRVSFLTMDFLDESQSFPPGYDAIWMSQFLDCFSQKEIVSILQRAAQAMPADGNLYILETFWDRQPNETSAFCLQQTSLYFACIANGNSQMYHSADLMECVQASGLKVIEDHDNVGLCHTLLKCRKA
jgi:ubiquinone/menaquinone biosynthesis C-methylase UbiE